VNSFEMKRADVIACFMEAFNKVNEDTFTMEERHRLLEYAQSTDEVFFGSFYDREGHECPLAATDISGGDRLRDIQVLDWAIELDSILRRRPERTFLQDLVKVID
jgi:hypothetical protein